MKTVNKKLNKTQLATVWLLIISILLGAAYIVVRTVVKNMTADQPLSGAPVITDIRDGEGKYLNQLVAYPAVEESEMLFIEVENEYGRFGISRSSGKDGIFLFHYYVDGVEQVIPYTPPIVGAEGNFNYESLYAVETDDGYGMIPYLTYLCAAIGAPAVTERIDLPEDADKRNELLRDYGLTKDATIVSFSYGGQYDEEGKIIEDSESAHVIVIGDKALSGVGYYYWVDGRDYVYYTGSEYFSYAMAGFHEFVKGMLVVEGLANDSVYGPYLTTDFKKWTTHKFSSSSDTIFVGGIGQYKNYQNPTVIVNGSYVASVDKGLDYVQGETVFDGYETENGVNLTFDLEAMKKHPEFTRIKNALVGKNVGSYKDNPIIITLLNELYESEEKKLTFGDDGSVSYDYSISKIEAVITNSDEIKSGTVDSSAKLLEVTYRYTVGGKTVAHDCHAVIDLTTIGEENAAKFVGKTIGTQLDESIDISINYTKENSLKSTEKYVVTAINSIFTVDESGQGALVADTVTEDAYVTISYYRIYDGVKSNTSTTIIKLADIKDTDKLASLKEKLLGMSKCSCEIVAYNDYFYYEVMREFATYEIEEIEYFVANEIVVSFQFCNASERDPFYGDTFYKNTLTNEYSLYGLNSGSCETVVKLLGGVGSDSNSAVGLSGKTVAIGLTLDNMEKYDLYAHKIYFELPRLIFDASEAEGNYSDNLSDYGWASTLGFNLYISGVTYDDDGNRIRYIGSDMYDVIAKVPAEDFEFLEYGFVEFWARKNLMMMDITNLQGLKLDFNMSDLEGTYDFRLYFEDAYGGYDANGNYVIKYEEFDGASPIDTQNVKVTASENAFDSAFKDMYGTSTGDLSTLYNYTVGGGKTIYYPGSHTLLGAAYFNSVYETLQLIRYLDALSEEERATPITGTPIFRMTLDVADKDYDYTYEFYRIDDRRVRVRFFKSQNGVKIESYGEVSDYYVTMFAFKKLINNYIHLLDGKPVDSNVGYPEQ